MVPSHVPQSSRAVSLEDEVSGEKSISNPSRPSLKQLFYDSFQMFPAASLLPVMKLWTDPMGEGYVPLMPCYRYRTLLDTHPSPSKESSKQTQCTGCRRAGRRGWKERKTSCTDGTHIIHPEAMLATEPLSCCKEQHQKKGGLVADTSASPP